MSERWPQCAFENPDRDIFCPIAQEQIPLDRQICDTCLKANTKKGEDLSPEDLITLYPQLNPTLVALIITRSLENNPLITPDPTPLKTFHRRLLNQLPFVFHPYIFEKLALELAQKQKGENLVTPSIFPLTLTKKTESL